MKTRIIHTKLWKDSRLRKLSPESQHFFLYLLTCEHIGLTGIFELPDELIIYEFRTTERDLDKIKAELSEHEIVFFYEDWVVVKNAVRYNNFQASPKTAIAFNREYDAIPIPVLEFLDSSIDTSMYTLNNHKPKIINNKTETINHKSYASIARKLAEEKSL